MGERRRESSFSDVDAAETPEAFVRSLDIQNASAFKQEYARRTFALLDLRPGLRVLDAGCGVGLDAARMAELVAPGGEVTGLDYSATMVEEAQSRHGSAGLPLTFVQGDLGALPFDDCSFDRCRATGTFQHLADPRRALDELVRVLAPGGLVLIADGDHETQVIDSPYPELTRRFLAWRSDTLAQGGVAHRLYAWYRELGLEGVTVEAMTRIATDYAAINSVMHYDGGMRVARDEGVVTAEEADRWIAYVEEAGHTDRFFCAFTYLMTVGRKPANLTPNPFPSREGGAEHRLVVVATRGDHNGRVIVFRVSFCLRIDEGPLPYPLRFAHGPLRSVFLASCGAGRPCEGGAAGRRLPPRAEEKVPYP